MVCDSCVDVGLVATLGTWGTKRADSFECRVRIVLESPLYCKSVIDWCKWGRDPPPMFEDVFGVCPSFVEIRRYSSINIRCGILRVKKHLPPANVPGLEDIFGRGGEVST